jgi:hypothetical protein
MDMDNDKDMDKDMDMDMDKDMNMVIDIINYAEIPNLPISCCTPRTGKFKSTLKNTCRKLTKKRFIQIKKMRIENSAKPLRRNHSPTGDKSIDV